MINTEFEQFIRVAKVTQNLLFEMSYIWEQMQFNDTEPKILNFNPSYPFDKSFDDVAWNFLEWVETLEGGENDNNYPVSVND